MRRLSLTATTRELAQAVNDLTRAYDETRAGNPVIKGDLDMRGRRLINVGSPQEANDGQIKRLTDDAFAPIDGPYIATVFSDALTNERVLTGSSSILVTDNGGGSTVVVSAIQAFFDALYQPLDEQLTSLAALSYTGNTLKLIRVNAGETGFELVAAGSGGIGTVTSVDGSGGTTGLTLTGGPITASGTLTLGGTLIVANGGTGRTTSTTAYGLLAAGTTATGAHQTLAAGATTEILVGGGASALPVWTTATGTGAPVRAGSPALTGTATAETLNLSGGSGMRVARDSASDFTAILRVQNSDITTVPIAALQYFEFLDTGGTVRQNTYFGARKTAHTGTTTTTEFVWAAANASASATLLAGLDTSAFYPKAAGGIALGKVALGFGSLFLDEAGAGTQTAQIIAPALSADIVLTTPAATGTLATLAGTETFTNKTLTAPTISGVVANIGFSSGGVITNGSGAISIFGGAGNTSIGIDDGGNRIDFNDTSGTLLLSLIGSSNAAEFFGVIGSYNNINTVEGGVPALRGVIAAASQSATLATTTVYAAPATGHYRFNYYIERTTAATSTSSLTPVLTFTGGDSNVAQTVTLAANTTNSTTTGALTGTYDVYARTGTNIRFGITYASTGATAMVYNYRVSVEAL